MEEHIKAQIKRALEEKEASIFKGLTPTLNAGHYKPTLRDRLKRKIEAASPGEESRGSSNIGIDRGSTGVREQTE